MTHDSNSIQLTIQHMTHEGYGFASLNGKKYLVPFTLPGEVVIAQNPKPYRSHLLCELSEILQPSANRISAPCLYYTQCGGCNLQHMSYATQLNFKQSWIEDFFGADCPVLPIIASPQAIGYRNRITLHQTKTSVGFFKPFSKEVIDIKSCLLASPKLSDQLDQLREQKQLQQTNIELREDEQSHFIQINSLQNSNLINTVLDFTTVTKKSHVLELYCGAGNLTLPLSKSGCSILAVDNSESAIQYARQKSKENKPNKIEFHKDDVHNFVFSLCQNLKRFDILLCDPPRQGLLNTVSLIKRLDPKSIVYVSCNPLSFKKDLTELSKSGYRLQKIQPLDMFPQTHHVEIIGLIQKQ